jgi:hypothetical protein
MPQKLKNNMKKQTLFLIFLAIQLLLFGQLNKIEVKAIGLAELPTGIYFKGHIVEALTWKDKNGQNIFILSSIGPLVEESDEHESKATKEIFANQYTINDNILRKLWELSSLKRVCPMNVELEFIPNSTSITDLDGNGFTETTIAYKFACRSDVSLAEFTVLMHENFNEFGLHGHTLIRAGKPYSTMELSTYEFNLENAMATKEFSSDFSKYNGRYLNTKEFDHAPNQFLNHAIDIWKKFVEEKM